MESVFCLVADVSAVGYQSLLSLQVEDHQLGVAGFVGIANHSPEVIDVPTTVIVFLNKLGFYVNEQLADTVIATGLDVFVEEGDTIHFGM